MTMLTHELKTPLSVVSLALGDSGSQPRIRERARRAVENMRDVIDRCAQSARLVDEGDPAEPASALEPLDPAEVLREGIEWQGQADRIDLCVPDRLPVCPAVRMTRLRAKFSEVGGPQTVLRSLRTAGYQLCVELRID